MKNSLKFNLYLPSENKKIRNIDDLKNNFNIDDILELYKSKILQRWIGSRLEEDDYYKIKKIIDELDSNLEDKKLMLKLYKIFIPNDPEDIIKKTIEDIFESRRVAKLKLELIKAANEDFNKKKQGIINEYLNLICKLIEKGGSEFKETMDTLKIINDDWSEFFKLNCATIIDKLCFEKCHIALLGLLIHNNLKRIANEEMDDLTNFIWNDEFNSIPDFCKFFAKKYNNKNGYKELIIVKKIKNIFDSGKGVKIIASGGDNLILNIPAYCKVRNNEGEHIAVGNICEGELKLSPAANLNIVNCKDNITSQLHYIEIRNNE